MTNETRSDGLWFCVPALLPLVLSMHRAQEEQSPGSGQLLHTALRGNGLPVLLCRWCPINTGISGASRHLVWPRLKHQLGSGRVSDKSHFALAEHSSDQPSAPSLLQALSGPHYYTWGDHGGILVAIAQGTETDQLK